MEFKKLLEPTKIGKIFKMFGSLLDFLSTFLARNRLVSD
jgi:hypothetical protein